MAVSALVARCPNPLLQVCNCETGGDYVVVKSRPKCEPKSAGGCVKDADLRETFYYARRPKDEVREGKLKTRDSLPTAIARLVRVSYSYA